MSCSRTQPGRDRVQPQTLLICFVCLICALHPSHVGMLPTFYGIATQTLGCHDVKCAFNFFFQGQGIVGE